MPRIKGVTCKCSGDWKTVQIFYTKLFFLFWMFSMKMWKSNSITVQGIHFRRVMLTLPFSRRRHTNPFQTSDTDFPFSRRRHQNSFQASDTHFLFSRRRHKNPFQTSDITLPFSSGSHQNPFQTSDTHSFIEKMAPPW